MNGQWVTWVTLKLKIHSFQKTLEYTRAIKEKMSRFLTDVDKIRRTAEAKRGKTWNEKVDDLISILENGVDIKCSDTERIEYMQEIFGVAEGDDELLLYKDNCKPKCLRRQSGTVLNTRIGY